MSKFTSWKVYKCSLICSIKVNESNEDQCFCDNWQAAKENIPGTALLFDIFMLLAASKFAGKF